MDRDSAIAHTAKLSDPSRQSDLAKIHIAKKQLGWDESTYRDILQTVCGVRSSSELTTEARQRFLAHLAKCGWSDGKPAHAKKQVRNPLTRPQKRMWSLWQQLAEAGLVDNRKMPALLAYATRITSVDRLEWLNRAQEDLVIETLKQWLKRGADGAAK